MGAPRDTPSAVYHRDPTVSIFGASALESVLWSSLVQPVSSKLNGRSAQRTRNGKSAGDLTELNRQDTGCRNVAM